MVLWAGFNNLPKPYRGWNVAVAEKSRCDKQQLTAAYMKLLVWLRDYMSVDTVTLLLPAEDRKNLAVCATIGLEEEIAQQIRIPIGRGIAGGIAASGKSKIADNLLEEEIVSPILRQKGLRSLVGVPLPMEQGLTGVLHVGSFQHRQFNDRDIQQLQLVVHRLKSVMAQAQSLKYLPCPASQTNSRNYLSYLAWLKVCHKIAKLPTLQQSLKSYWSHLNAEIS